MQLENQTEVPGMLLHRNTMVLACTVCNSQNLVFYIMKTRMLKYMVKLFAGKNETFQRKNCDIFIISA